MCKVMEHYERIAREEGREEGIVNALLSLVHDGLLSLNEAAKRAGLSEDAFRAKLNEMYA